MNFQRQFVRPFSSHKNRLAVSFLDLRGSGLSILERLLMEECLLQHDHRNWIVAGQHEALPHRYLQKVDKPAYVKHAQSNNSDMYNPSTAIVMGIGGKPHELLNIPMVKEEGCLVLKRFSGGGTVVLDHDSIWTTLIFRNSNAVPDDPLPEAFPRPIMDWSANRIFGRVFAHLKAKQMKHTKPIKNEQITMVSNTKSCGLSDDSGRLITIPAEPFTIPSASSNKKLHKIPPDFELRENDYILGDRKMGGNAQTIVKNGWLHHTSFLWDFEPENMQYLTLPNKRPDYRNDRAHDEFLMKLNQAYPSLTKKDFITTLGSVCEQEFKLDRVTLTEALKIVADKVGSMQEWFDGKARTRIIADLPDIESE
eukprot:scaffold2429_cov165-Amphora_coffeaeformis.AAC.14